MKRPEVDDVGTVVPNVVAVAVPSRVARPFNVRLSSLTVAWKFVPLTVTAVPGVPIVGEKLVMVGAEVAITENELELVAVPFGDVTEIGPVVAPAGTVAMTWFVVAEVTWAAVPLNVTVF